jgi:hypothetical protein
MSSDLDALRSLVREVIRDVLSTGRPVIETVNLSTDDDLASFVKRLLDLAPGEREELRSGRKRFSLAALPVSPVSPVLPVSPVPAGEAGQTWAAAPVRRIERGAVTEKVIKAAAEAGQRLVLGPGAVLTPLARDRARARGVRIEKER